MTFSFRLAACLLAIFSQQAAAGGDAAAGQAKSAICSACHGADGNSMVPQWPKLAGQHEEYLVRQVTLIKSGARPVPERPLSLNELGHAEHRDPRRRSPRTRRTSFATPT